MQSFEELSLPSLLANGLKRIGFINPTPIQKKGIPALMEGRDLMACAQTGSGKTGAYLIPMIAKLLANPESQGLVLAPTRELAQQISDFLQSLIADPRHLHTVRLIGGQDIRKQFKSLQRKPRVIVATPGRLIDHLKRNTLQIHKVDQLVLDEGDRMIDMGFAPQLEQILKYLSQERQTSFFTATLDHKVKGLAQKYLKNPISLMLDEAKPVAKIKQTVIKVDTASKDECIVDELNRRQGSVIVFVKTKHRTDRLKRYLVDYGFKADLIHGGRSQGQRNQALKAFKSGRTRILCATDVAARGIDVPHVEHVINFDLPMQDEDYVHRVGRTARNGADGEAVSFVTSHEYRDWNRLVKKYNIPNAMIEMPKSNKDRGQQRPKGHGGRPAHRGGQGARHGGPSRSSGGHQQQAQGEGRRPFRFDPKRKGSDSRPNNHKPRSHRPSAQR